MSKLMEIMQKRRSIRKYLPTQISCEDIIELIKAAQIAPSGCNAQPWRFKIVTDQDIKDKLMHAAKNQKFISEAPVVLVCCADIQGYIDGTVSGAQDLYEISAVEKEISDFLINRGKSLTVNDAEYIYPRVESNVAIAVEHIILRAVELGLGTCWVRLFNEVEVKRIFGWNDTIHVVALLPVGYPAEDPGPRKRLPLEKLIIE